MRPLALSALLALTLGVFAPLVKAAGFTDRGAWEAAVAALDGATVTEGFDSLLADTILESGSASSAVTFVYDFGNVDIQVHEVTALPTEFSTTSQPNYGGTDDGGVFQDGDDFDIRTGTPVRALGLSITTIDAIEAGEVRLATATTVVDLDPASVQSVLVDGASEFFLGIVEHGGFSEISLTTIGGGFFLYAVDDLTVLRPASIFSDRFEP